MTTRILHLKPLRRAHLRENPVRQFAAWYHRVRREGKVAAPETMCLSTVRNGRPEARYMLLKGFDRRGFVFYTNARSNKGKELRASRHAALTFFWNPPGWQVRITGRVARLRAREADAYFRSRPREHQVGAWASRQSRVIPGRAALEKRFAAFVEKFRNRSVPRPPHWTGYRLLPRAFEFFQYGDFRLNDRFLYTPTSRGGWTIRRLSP